MAIAEAPSRTRTPARWAGRLLVGTLTFVLAGFLGRATIIDGESLSLIWPAAGIAGLWIGSGDRRAQFVDVAALALATFTVNHLTGASTALASVFVVTNVVQVCTFVLLVRRWIPGLWGFGGSAPLARLVELGRLSVAALLGCLLGANLGALGLQLILGSVDPASFLVWWGRNTVALIVVVVLGVLVGEPLTGAPDGRARWALVRSALTPRTLGRTAEISALIGVSAALYVLLFLTPAAAPMAFLLLVCTVWAGIRFAPLAVTAHGLAMGATGIAFTLAGIGPFAQIESLQYRALVAQVFVAMAVLKGLALSFSRVERDEAIVELAAARGAADERAQLLDAVLESMKEGVVVIEEGGRILVRNAAGRRLVGLDPPTQDTIEPAEDHGLFHPNGLPVLDRELPGVRALGGETVSPEDFQIRAASVPEGRVVEISAQPLKDTPGAPRRAMVNLRDVTLDRQHRDTLASFAGVVAHDLFNPLSLVQGWSETLDDEFANGPVEPTVGLPMVARIHEAAAHMRLFIGDLMAYTVARDQSLRAGAVDLTVLVRQLARLRTDGAAAPVIAVDDDLLAWADEGLVRQLFDNLLGNAVKYVAPGVRPMIAVTGRLSGFHVEIRVTDNGIGIPAEERDRIFESFHRVHDGYHGTGLGLAICHRIVDRHGGSIRVESGPDGNGSSFVLTLPVAPTAAWRRLASNPVEHQALHGV